MKAKTKFLTTAGLIVLASGLLQVGGPQTLAQESDRAKRVGKRLICMCNCNQILTACNHVGCTVSTSMLKKLDQVAARNESDDLTIQAFIQDYGQTVLAEPPAKGFNRIAWFIPGIAFALGLAVVITVIQHWRKRIVLTPAGPPIPPELLARRREQADRETEE